MRLADAPALRSALRASLRAGAFETPIRNDQTDTSTMTGWGQFKPPLWGQCRLPFSNAVRVEVDGEHVGHLPRGSAKRFNRRLRALNEEGKRAICMAYIGRAEDGQYLGISLRVPYDGEILQGKR